MKRDNAIEYYQDKLQRTQRSLNVIKNIPLKIPLKLKVRTLGKYISKKGWNHEIVTFAAIPITLNSESVRFQFIARSGSNRGYYSNPREKDDKGIIKFEDILGWEPLVLEDLPLFIGSHDIHPLLKEYLEKGEIPCPPENARNIGTSLNVPDANVLGTVSEPTVETTTVVPTAPPPSVPSALKILKDLST